MTKCTNPNCGYEWKPRKQNSIILFRKYVGELGKHRDFGGKELPKTIFGYRTGVDWEAVEDFFSEQIDNCMAFARNDMEDRLETVINQTLKDYSEDRPVPPSVIRKMYYDFLRKRYD